MSQNFSEMLGTFEVVDLKIGKPSLPNKIGEALIATYGEGVHVYPMNRENIQIKTAKGEVFGLGNAQTPLVLTLQDAISTLQPHVHRNLPEISPTFIPSAGVLGAHDVYVRVMKAALETFNKINRPYYKEAGIQPMIGGMLTGATTFFSFVEHIEEAALEHIKIPLSADDNWAVRSKPLEASLRAAYSDGIFPLGFTSISPDAPIHKIRDRDTAHGLYLGMQSLNDERMAMLVTYSGGQQRFDALKATHPDFADAIAILQRPKIFDDLVYLPVEAGYKNTCLYTELHDELPEVTDDIVTAVSLSKIGLAGPRSGAMFVANAALAKRAQRTFHMSVEGLNFSAHQPLTLLHRQHPDNGKFRASIRDYCEDLYCRSAYFAALFQGPSSSFHIKMNSLPRLSELLGNAQDPITRQPLVVGPIAGIQLLGRDPAGYFTNLHFDDAVWGKVLDAVAPLRGVQGVDDITAMQNILSQHLKIELMPIRSLKDSAGKPMMVFRMNGHTSFENLTAVYARLHHMAQHHGLVPAHTVTSPPTSPTRCQTPRHPAASPASDVA